MGRVGVPEALERRTRSGSGPRRRDGCAVGAKPAAGSRRTLPAAGDGPRVVVVVGPGKGESTPEDLRRAAGAGVRQAGRMAEEDPLGGGRLGRGLDAKQRRRRRSTARQLPLCLPHSAAERLRGGVRDRAITVVDPGGAPERRRWARLDAGPCGRHGPRVGQHCRPNLLYPESFAAQAASTGQDGTRGGRDLDEKALPGTGTAACSRSAAGRPAAAVGPVELSAARREGPSGAGRQGDHVRHRRAEPQAGRRHVHDEV